VHSRWLSSGNMIHYFPESRTKPLLVSTFLAIDVYNAPVLRGFRWVDRIQRTCISEILSLGEIN